MAVSTYKDPASGSTITGVTSSSGKSKSGAYTNAGATSSAYKKIYQDYGIIKKDSTPKTTTTVVQTPSSSGSSYTPSNGGEDIIGKIKSLLEEQKRAADEYYKTMYEQQLSEINQQAEANRNSANLNYMRGDRYLRSMYGNNISGQGLSNRARNNSMWQNNLSSIRQNQANNAATAKSNYNLNLANTASQLAQGWYNYVLPYYSNEANQLRNIELQKYAMSL